MIGYDHQFGRDREGSIADLEEFAVIYGFQIEQIEAQTFEDINISSTKIRKALAEGDFETANQFLGYEFSLSGEVVHGFKRGKQIGFPTANISVNNPFKLIPSQGVYAVSVMVDGAQYGGMLNIGSKPTVSNENTLSIEVHIFDFSSDIYGKTVSVYLKKRIRNEKKFDNLEELRLQLEKDKQQTETILG